jgi:hypothetical protein
MEYRWWSLDVQNVCFTYVWCRCVLEPFDVVLCLREVMKMWMCDGEVSFMITATFW